MPELPEVETVCRQLAPLVCGQRVASLSINDRARLSVERPTRLVGMRTEDVFRLGKQVVMHFVQGSQRRGRRGADCAGLYLAVHLRMSGRLLWREGNSESSDRHLRARLNLERGMVCLVDPRRFGQLYLVDDIGRLRPSGIDPLSVDLSDKVLRTMLADSRQALKPWLLRQDRLVGLGNIYASEICFHAGLNPCRPSNGLSAGEVKRLLTATRRVLRSAIRHCGTTFSDFQGADGVTGAYQRYLAVYGREGQPCPRCGQAIQRLVQQQRSTFFCARCQ